MAKLAKGFGIFKGGLSKALSFTHKALSLADNIHTGVKSVAGLDPGLQRLYDQGFSRLSQSAHQARSMIDRGLHVGEGVHERLNQLEHRGISPADAAVAIGRTQRVHAITRGGWGGNASDYLEAPSGEQRLKYD